MAEPAATASVAAATTPAPYRVPIQVVPPDSDYVSAMPDFRVCLLDHLLTRDQRAGLNAASNSQPQLTAQPASHTLPASERPRYDRLPLTMAIASRATGGVTGVTLMPNSASAEWLRRRQEQQTDADADAEQVRLIPVPMAHAARCPCRTPGPVASLPDPTTPLPVLRLAVVVVPRVPLSVAHCGVCAPSLPPDTPCARALLTRRPRVMRAFPGCWVFPGGACDPTDASLEHTGAREALEETGLHVDPRSMRMVCLWEAVYPVIRPRDQVEPFLAKARYVIAMFAAQIEHPTTSAPADASSSDATFSSTPVCVSCLPLTLCPTEVDAGVWLSGAQFERLRLHATYIHTEDEAQLQAAGSSTTGSRECAEDPSQPCQCEWLPARVTEAYRLQNASQTQLHATAASSATAAAAAAAPASSVPPDSSASTPLSAAAFRSASVRACCLYGLYPNSLGSGVAEGHLVALEEMRELGLI